MLLLSQAPNGALSSSILPSSSSNSSSNPIRNPTLFSKSKSKSSKSNFPSLYVKNNNSNRTPLDVAASAADGDAGPTSRRPLPLVDTDTVSVGDDGVPLEGVIQFDRPDAGSTTSKLLSWAQVAFLAGGDVLSLLVFSAIGRFSHGFPVLDFETFRTADPFISGWFLSAYFLGGYSDDGKGLNGTNHAIIAAAKSWAVGIPLGIIIRAVMSGHIPATAFMLVTMGSTGVLMIGWRALACNVLPSKQNKNDVYKRGSPFELFELLTSLVRRW